MSKTNRTSYRPTLNIWTLSDTEIAALPVGQWVSAGTPDATRSNCGQYCGVKRSGTVVVAWNGNARSSGNASEYRRVHRLYAKTYRPA